MLVSKSIRGPLAVAGLAALAFFGGAYAQAPTTVVARFSAQTANLAGSPEPVRIDVLAWSTDADRARFVDAWNLILPAQTEGRGGGAPARGGLGARGGAAAEAPAAPDAPPAAPARGRGARGAPGGPPAEAIAAPAPPSTPDAALAAALRSAEGVGYLWSSESVGYSLRYAYRITQPDGGVRIVLATDRRLGAFSGAWKPAAGELNDYAFSVIELRLNPGMEGEGKASLTGRVSIDKAVNTIALEDYAALPVILTQVRPADVH